jgi:CDP-glucose 4,6-dehydratase
MFKGVYKGLRVLVTGHTGFKGSWLSAWLLNLGAEVAGYSIGIPTEPSNFKVIGLEKMVSHNVGDVRHYGGLKEAFDRFKPDIVFHLAAQAITRLSYGMPRETFDTNVGGAVNVLECTRHCGSVRAAVIVTSDKCYKNVEWVWGYRENDALGGDDPYSASKACAEVVFHSYVKSFFSLPDSARAATGRAGNVIGGGDWAVDRIIPDCVRALSEGRRLEIRNPRATRPWQHVLEPLSGYLCLGANLLTGSDGVRGESFNFGPGNDTGRSVEELTNEFLKWWEGGGYRIREGAAAGKKESTLLKLDCDKALRYLNWKAVLAFDETAKMTALWYRRCYEGAANMHGFTVGQIGEYSELAARRGLPWAI